MSKLNKETQLVAKVSAWDVVDTCYTCKTNNEIVELLEQVTSRPGMCIDWYELKKEQDGKTIETEKN